DLWLVRARISRRGADRPPGLHPSDLARTRGRAPGGRSPEPGRKAQRREEPAPVPRRPRPLTELEGRKHYRRRSGPDWRERGRRDEQRVRATLAARAE